MRDNNFDRAQAAYDAMLPDHYDDVPMTCPECDGDTDNGDEGGALPCDECLLDNCAFCGEEFRPTDLHEWEQDDWTKPSLWACWECYKANTPSPAEDGRW